MPDAEVGMKFRSSVPPCSVYSKADHDYSHITLFHILRETRRNELKDAFNCKMFISFPMYD